MNPTVRLGLLATALLIGASQVNAQSYTFTDLGAGYAKAINDVGQVVGTTHATHDRYGNPTATAQDAFLLSVSAVPEPESYGMLLAGLGLMGFMVRRRKAA